MKNSKYWENRANQRMAIYHKNSDKTIETITKAYDKAVKDIEEEIRKIYDKFSTAGKLSPAETRKLLNSKIPVKELNRIRNKIKHIQDEDIKRQLLSILNSPAYKARITRLEALKQNVYIQSKIIADVELKATTSQYIDTINKAYYRHIFDIQKGLGIGFDVAAISTKTIEEILKNPWSGKHFSERIWNNTDVLAEKLIEIITSGFMSGKSIDKMVRELKDYTEYGKFAAARLVRTETTYMANAAEMESYRECGIEKYIYVATLDNRTSDICQSLDRKVFNVKDGVPGENMPPMHPHCRSTTRAYTLKGIKRRARDPKTGKTYLVPADMSYKEWYQKYVVDKYGKDQAEIMKKKIINKARDKKQYKRYKEVLGKDMPVKSFDKFQDLKYNDIKEWKNLKGFYKYKLDNPKATKTHYLIKKELEELGIKGQINIPPKIIDVSDFSFDDYHINIERNHNVTRYEAEEFINNAKVSITKWKGQIVNYYSNDGATYLDIKNKKIRTSFKKYEFDELTKRMLEVINKYE